ncbi:MAG: hypothetical protein M1331_01060 [Candidatus Marsarchaeota archaeon]|nr:hypothetical protein [Candidatus Marsarchaeota archaeon]MCL5105973.1 hypothetical protein [Candidatus Marsarchaeota archaeon]
MDSTKFNNKAKKAAAIATMGLVAATGLTLTGCATSPQTRQQLYAIDSQLYGISNFMWNFQDFWYSMNQLSYYLNGMSYEKKQKINVYGEEKGIKIFLFSVQRISEKAYLIKDSSKKSFLFDKSNASLEKFLVFHRIIVPKPATVLEADNNSNMLRKATG